MSRLNEGGSCKLILVSAPAGFGKSTLISEWARNLKKPVSWLSLDDNDNNFKLFLKYLISAIQQIDGSIGESILSSLEVIDNPPTESIVTVLINEITEYGKEFYLVLDDYHLITSQKIHDTLDYFIEHIPPIVHLVIGGRIDPPLSLSRLRAGGHLIEIRPNDLRFTEDEVTVFLNDLVGLDLSPEDILALLVRTEGWITGLKLAALSLRDRENKQEFVEAFSGSHHYIIDYLVDEVMSRQSEEIQEFLRQTSILDRFSAPLCNFVLEITGSKDILQYLDESNLFLIQLDDERNWYRYHHLFSDFLNLRMREIEPDAVLDLHKKAAQWLENNKYINEAIDQALKGEDYGHASRMIESIGPDMMMKSEFDQLTTGLDLIPMNLVMRWPWLCIIQGWMCDRWAQFDTGEKYLRSAEATLESSEYSASEKSKDIIRGQISAIRALYALKKGQISESIKQANQALNFLPDDHFNRGVATFTLGWAKKEQGDLSSAILAFEEGRKASRAVNNQILVQAIILEMGNTQVLQGHLHQAAETLNGAINYQYEKSKLKIPYAGPAGVSLGNIQREWNDLSSALDLVQEGIEISNASKIVDAVVDGYASLALVYLAQGDLGKAETACKKAESLVHDIPDLEPITKTKTFDSRVKLLLSQKKLTEAARYVQDRGMISDTEILKLTDYKHIIGARVLIHLSRESSTLQELTDAHRILSKTIKLAEPAGYTNLLIQALALQALAFDAQEKNDAALKSLENALSMAELGGYIRTFVDEGEPMRDLLQKLASPGKQNDYARKLITAFNADALAGKSLISQSQVDPLSERELEVLNFLASELSGPEIAQEIMVSINTMRTHTKNIYSKLGVNNRRAAVRQAKALKLI